jgi:outer membrane protein OmpA-like peptidoglycan-associated protein
MYKKHCKYNVMALFFGMMFTLFQVNAAQAQVSDVLTDIMNGQLSRYEVINQSKVNTAELEFSPAIFDSSIVYLANGRRISGMTRTETKKYFKLFISDIANDGSLNEERPFDAFRSDYNEGPLCFSKDGNKVYFTRNIKVQEADGKIRLNLNIFYSEKVNGSWSEPIELLQSTENVNYCHPALSSNGDRLYFSSNMYGGYGGYDLYCMEQVGGNWSTPINLGSEVNTEGNELFATLLSDGLLAFSANRTTGLGGYDIYIAQMDGTHVISSMHLTQPVNSAGDDMGLVVEPGNRYAFFSSSRTGGKGQDDIYLLKSLPMTKPVIAEQDIIVMDNSKMQRLQGIPCIITTVAGSPLNHGETDKNGVWKASLTMGESYILRITTSKYFPLEMPFISGEKIQAKLIPLPCVALSGVALDQETNQHLFNAEIKWVNDCGEPEMSATSDSAGYFNLCIPQGCSGLIIGKKNEFSTVRMPVNALAGDLNVNINFSKLVLSIVKGPLKKGGKLILENIYFDFNESTMRPATDRELNELTILMNQYPEMRVRIIAHTDSRGDNKFNLTLSLNRALEIKKYLMGKGISEDRLETEGRGESQLRNRCKDGVNCTEEEHQYNRRVEIQILEK